MTMTGRPSPNPVPSNVSVYSVVRTRGGCARMWTCAPLEVLPSAKGGTWSTPVLGISCGQHHTFTPWGISWMRWRRQWRQIEQPGRQMKCQLDKLEVPDRPHLFSHPQQRTLPLNTAEKVSVRCNGWDFGGRKLSMVTGAGGP